MSALRSRPVSVGHLRAFEAVARHLNFRAAADALALTQSAISRQIQSLEDEVGVPLFLRNTRAVELTAAGAQLLKTVTPLLTQLDAGVRQIRQTTLRPSVAVTTFASFASLWLIPRLEAFQRTHPQIDIRVDASDAPVDLELCDIDLALRYGPAQRMPAGAVRLFGEQLMPVASPWLLKSAPRVRTAADLAQFTLIEASDAHRSHLDWLTWQHWLVGQGLLQFQPQRWLHFNYAYQMVQAALSGQGVVLARPPLIAESLLRGDLVEVLPGMRQESPMAYWLLLRPGCSERPEVRAFCDWLLGQAEQTRAAIAQAPGPGVAD